MISGINISYLTHKSENGRNINILKVGIFSSYNNTATDGLFVDAETIKEMKNNKKDDIGVGIFRDVVTVRTIEVVNFDKDYPIVVIELNNNIDNSSVDGYQSKHKQI